MAMLAGSITVTDVNSDKTPVYTGTGLAKELFEADVASKVSAGIIAAISLPTLGQVTNPYSDAYPCPAGDVTRAKAGILVFYQGIARTSNVLATTIIGHIVTNAKANVTSESLGKTPDPNNANTAIQAPASPVLIPIV